MTPRDRKALIGGIAVVGLAVLPLRVVPWSWHAFADTRAEMEGRAERLSYLRAEIAGARNLEDSGAVVRATMSKLASVLLPGSGSEEAVSEITSRLAVAGERASVAIRRTDILTDSMRAGLARRVSIRASLESDTRGLLRLMDALARGPEAASVEEIQIAAEPVADPARPEILHAEITVSGWYVARRARR